MTEFKVATDDFKNAIKKRLLTVIVVLTVFSCVAISAWSKAIKPTPRQQFPVKTMALVGNWYMGTKCGFDCNLAIRPDNTLVVQFGGCFHQDPPIAMRWKLQDEKLRFQGSDLNDSLGSYLQVVRYKQYLVLVPERPQPNKGQHKYSYVHCFWRNLMKNGLQLPKAAPA